MLSFQAAVATSPVPQPAASMHHEHIVPVYSVGCERGIHFFAMQYIQGMSLAGVIAELRRLAGQGPDDPDRTGRIPPQPMCCPPLARTR